MCIQLSQLILKKNVTFLIASLLSLFFYSVCFADSSNIIPPLPQSTPAAAGLAQPYINCSATGAGTNINTGFNSNFATTCAWEIWGQQQTLSQCTYNGAPSYNWTCGYTAWAPFQTYSKNLAYQSIAVDGEYEIAAQFEFKQTSATPSYYWVDDWATSNDYGNGSVLENVRVFSSGDQPLMLNVGNGNSAIVYFSGRVHLRAGARVYFPRIWSACTDPTNCGTFYYLADFQCQQGTCSCFNSNWINGGTCFFMTLLSSP